MNSSKKRMAKAIERTLCWFDEQITSVKGINCDHEIRSSDGDRSDGSSNSGEKDQSSADKEDHSGSSGDKDNHSSDADRSCSDANTNSIGIDSRKVAFFGVAQYNPNYPVQTTAIVRNIILKGATGDRCYTSICDALIYSD